MRLLDGEAVVGEDRAGEPVRRALVDEVERVAPALVVVDVGRDGAEELLLHRPVAGVSVSITVGATKPLAVVVVAAGHDLGLQARASSIASFCVLNELASITAPMKLAKSETSPIFSSPDLLGKPLLQLGPHAPRRVDREAAEHFWP